MTPRQFEAGWEKVCKGLYKNTLWSNFQIGEHKGEWIISKDYGASKLPLRLRFRTFKTLNDAKQAVNTFAWEKKYQPLTKEDYEG